VSRDNRLQELLWSAKEGLLNETEAKMLELLGYIKPDTQPGQYILTDKAQARLSK
jgi:hypothetical protein